MDEHASPLEKLNERLYSTQGVDTFREEGLHPQAPAVTRGWDRTPPTPHKMSFVTVFFIVACAFFVIACGIAAFLYFRGTRAVSSENIKIQVTGPTTIASGDTVPITVTLQNNNPTAISNATLALDFPSGTRMSSDVNLPLDHYTDAPGDMAPGARVSRTVSGIVFGSQNETVTIPVQFQYRVAGSNAVFTASTTYSFVISTSPVSIQVQSVGEVDSGQTVQLSVAVHSNATVTLKDLAIDAQYPGFGFSLASTSLRSANGTFYPVGSLEPGETRTLQVSGVLSGNPADERTFNFAVGTTKQDGTAQLAASYTSTKRTVTITQPRIATTLSLDGVNTENVSALPGARINASLMWKNNLDTPLSNVAITVSLGGTGIDPASVQVIGGYYRSSDRTIIFTSEQLPALALLPARASGVATFSFAAKQGDSLKNNSNITLKVFAQGTRLGLGNVNSTLTRTIAIGTGLTAERSILRSTGSISNTGPIPPKPGVETTYTIALAAKSSVNTVGGASMKMTLPSYVRYTGVTSAGGEIAWDEGSRTVTWNVGDIAPAQSRTAAFQAALLPSTSQSGTSPLIVGAGTLTGTDKFTKGAVTVSLPALLLSTQGDPGFSPISGTIRI